MLLPLRLAELNQHATCGFGVNKRHQAIMRTKKRLFVDQLHALGLESPLSAALMSGTLRQM